VTLGSPPDGFASTAPRCRGTSSLVGHVVLANYDGRPNVVQVMGRNLVLLAFATWAATSCGSGFVGDCSGGRYEDGGCVNTQPTVHWTAVRAESAANHFTYAPMVRGHLSDANCRIVARRLGHEAVADCTALFTAPHTKPRDVRVVFDLSGTGVVNPSCYRTRANNPFCRWIRAHP
jgi:hypothetical protein